MATSEAFETYMERIGGEKLRVHDTPFQVFSIPSPSLLIHYPKAEGCNTFSSTFFCEWLNKHQQNNTKVIHVWHDRWIAQPQLITYRIQSLLGKNKRVFARQTEVVRLDKKTADSFLNQYHLQGSTNAYYKLGLMHQNQLIAVATFSKARTMYDGPVYYRSYELERFVTNPQLNVVGGLSKLLKYFCELTSAKHIMTYADRDWSDGNSYLKIGFKLHEVTPPQLFWIDTTTQQRFFAKEIQSENEGLIPVYNTGSLKFIWDNR